MPYPDALSLETIATGSGMLSAPVRNNDAAIQVEFNKLQAFFAALASASEGQVPVWSGGGWTVGAATPVVVRGRVNADGTIAGGSGFTVVKDATGVYTVTFTSEFAAVPVVVGSALHAVNDRVSNLQIKSPAVGSVVIETLETQGGGTTAKKDVGFHFIAYAVA